MPRRTTTDIGCGSFDQPDLQSSVKDCRFFFSCFASEILKGIFKPFPTVYYTPPDFMKFQSLNQKEKSAVVYRVQIRLIKRTAANFGFGSFWHSFLLVQWQGEACLF